MSRATSPLVSVIVPCYNLAKYLPEALESIIEQTYPNWECIIINDGSTDNTGDIALVWTKKDGRFKYLYKANGGVSEARNLGINISNGEYILPLDADDKIGAKYLELAVQCYQKNPNLKLVYCNSEFFGERKGKWDIPVYDYQSMLLGNLIFCSAVFKRVDFDKTSGYSKELKYSIEDWNFWLDLLSKDDEVLKLDESLFYYRIRNDSRTRSVDQMSQIVMENKIFANHLDDYSRNGISALYCMRKYIEIKNSRSFMFGYFMLHPFTALKKILNNGKSHSAMRPIFFEQ
jgi:glycosyltransferase involved in cell wall biosynthesis